MMGFQETPARLFYDFCLDDHVPFDHLLKGALIATSPSMISANR